MAQTRLALMLRMNNVCSCGSKSVCVHVQCSGVQGSSGQCSVRDGGSEGGPRAEGEGPPHPAAGLGSSCGPDPLHQVIIAFRNRKEKEKKREEKKRKEKERKGKERKEKKRKEKKRKGKERKDYAFRHQFNEKPSIIPGCPGVIAFISGGNACTNLLGVVCGV